MFTGIVEEIGLIASMDVRTGATSLVINCQTALNGMHLGDSIAVNGVCLTVLDLSEYSFTTEAVPETLHRTNLGNLNQGSPADGVTTPLNYNLYALHCLKTSEIKWEFIDSCFH